MGCEYQVYVVISCQRYDPIFILSRCGAFHAAVGGIVLRQDPPFDFGVFRGHLGDKLFVFTGRSTFVVQCEEENIAADKVIVAVPGAGLCLPQLRRLGTFRCSWK